jgi:hypothetical protein
MMLAFGGVAAEREGKSVAQASHSIPAWGGIPIHFAWITVSRASICAGLQLNGFVSTMAGGSKCCLDMYWEIFFSSKHTANSPRRREVASESKTMSWVMPLRELGTMYLLGFCTCDARPTVHCTRAAVVTLLGIVFIIIVVVENEEAGQAHALMEVTRMVCTGS